MSRSVLLVTPPYHCGVVEVAGRWMPLGMLYLAGAAQRAGWDAALYDAMSKDHDHAQIRERIAALQPDCVATSAITPTFPDALEVLRAAKALRPDVITVLGGVHPTFMHREILEAHADIVDFVVLGEGEVTFEELLNALDRGGDLSAVRGLAFHEDGELVVTEPRPFLEDLDQPRAPWELIDWSDYRYFVIPRSRLAVVSTARGCSFSCTFCSQQKFWKKSWRGRDPKLAADEILMLRERFGVNVFLIADEYPTQDQARWLDFLERLIHARFDGHLLMETRAGDIVRDAEHLQRYRKAGVVHVYVGLEATDQATLDLINKDLTLDESVETMRLLRHHGLVSETSFVLGFPWETPESIRATLALATQYNPDFAHFLAITPWPYAEIYEQMAPHIVDRDLRNYNLVEPVIKPERMTIAQVNKAIVDSYRSFYMGKVRELESDPDPFRQRYMLTSMRLMMESSFLRKKMGRLGRIPLEVERLLRKLNPRRAAG